MSTMAPRIENWSFAFGEVRHLRLRPRRHALRASVYTIEGEASGLDGRPIGSWLVGIDRPALIAFLSRDHGDGSPPAQWIGRILSAAGLPEPASIRFRGFARVLGHAFKPVSFWFCANADGECFAIVAEVNNTFGERHCYLLTDPRGGTLRNGQLLTAEKVFHVSPFCRVSGDYRFRFLSRGDRHVARIDLEDEGGPLLVTSLGGRSTAMGTRSRLRALLGYPLFSLTVIFRIHWHALLLWLKRVPWFSKPEPPDRFVTTSPRPAPTTRNSA